MADDVVLEVTSFAVGGDGVARNRGKVVFVRGALPGERALVRITQRKHDFSRGETVSVEQPSPHRVEPFCPRVAAGCGGCDWQHVDIDAQVRHKVDMVAGAMRRIGRIEQPELTARQPVALPGRAFRTTVRLAVAADGRLGYRGRSSHDVCVAGACPVAHPRLARLLDAIRAPGATELTLRTTAASSDTTVIVDPPSALATLGDVTQRWSEIAGGPVHVVSALTSSSVVGPAVLTERIAGVDLRVSPGSFFQTRTDGAEALVRVVGVALAEARGADSRERVLIDLYGGVGLFAATLGRDASAVISVEASASSSEDAAHNLAASIGPAAVAAHADVDEWRPDPLSFVGRRVEVVADPSRRGLGPRGVETIDACGADTVVLVSCDAASGARDLAALGAMGFTLRAWTVVDLFPHTAHVEVVALLTRDGA